MIEFYIELWEMLDAASLLAWLCCLAWQMRAMIRQQF